MKLKIIPLLLGCLCASQAYADFNPVTLTSNSYTFDIVVETNVVPAMPALITATVGGGTGKGDSTFYEQGFWNRTGGGLYSGVPIHGTVFTSQSDANTQYQMPADYTINNTLLIDSGVTSGTLTLNTPLTCTNLSILGTGGSSGVTAIYTVNHQDGVTTETGNYNPGDWFGGANPAWYCGGRVSVGGGFSATSTGGTSTGGAVGSNPRMYT
ncbi:MAG TPA: hypothetical protein VF607_05345, partial [Verrucomicrobiae bacterium]